MTPGWYALYVFQGPEAAHDCPLSAARILAHPDAVQVGLKALCTPLEAGVPGPEAQVIQ